MGRNIPKKNGKIMNCIGCRGGLLNQGQTTFAVDEDGVLVVIRKVPALICDQCGEEYLDEIVTQRLETEVNNALRTGEKVIIQEFRAA